MRFLRSIKHVLCVPDKPNPEINTFGATIMQAEAPFESSNEQLIHQLQNMLGIAVGTLIAERPPHRSVRAGFPHTAPTLGV